jgi:hypothetical protein
MSRQLLYSVLTLYDCLQDPSTVAWLVNANVNLPDETPAGRYPAPAEIREIMDAVPGIWVDYRVSDTVWEMTARSRKDVLWASLAIRDYSGDADSPHHFEFTAGWDEMVLLVSSHLAKRCGPLVLLHDSGAPPQVVM